MTAGQWDLDPLEFDLVWRQFGRDRLPYPLQYHSTDELASDFRRSRALAAAEVRTRMDEDLYRAFAVLADPSAHVAMFGLDSMNAMREKVIRIHAGVREGVGAVAVQEPGADGKSGAGIRLTLLDAEDVPRQLVRALPSARAGVRAPLSVDAAELGDRVGGSYLTGSHALTVPQQVSAYVDRPRRATGEVTATPGPAVDTRPSPRAQGFRWIDFVDDGRYLTRQADRLTVEPASDAVMVTQIERLIESAVQRNAAGLP
ncbi:ESX secretion-associated protein EspG [Rhodococcus sp. NPDC058481]|uniref:ESX secretion-associated protein EspG n=1 Tax=unclassified Rhodococcus (in: high G+C Gram-positive bacteria) TaxID=192944 RepID=UPI0036477F0F